MLWIPAVIPVKTTENCVCGMYKSFPQAQPFWRRISLGCLKTYGKLPGKVLKIWGFEDIIGTLDLFSGKTHSDHNLARGTGYAGGDSGIYRIFRKG